MDRFHSNGSYRRRCEVHRSALAVICSLDAVDILVTDDFAPPAAPERLSAADVQGELC